MASRAQSSFVAYPGSPVDLSSPITVAADALRNAGIAIKAWPRMEVFGAQIPDEVRTCIENADIIFADVTHPNLNVFFEIGYGIGLGKTFAPIVNTAFAGATASIRSLGLFSNIGYQTYENSDELQTIFKSTPRSPLLDLYARDINYSQPIYVLDTMRKTDFRNAVVSAVKESRSHFRSFDPIENARITVVQLIAEVTSSSGIVIPYLARHIDDSERHNLRAALIAGLALGLTRDTLIVTDQEDDQAPTDYNEKIVIAPSQAQIADRVKTFCSEAVLIAQEIPVITKIADRSTLQLLSLGSSAAENEFRDLGSYFVETSEYLRASRGELNIITGRKGSGKSAIFFQVRDHARRRKDSLVVDLKPESHRLSSFRQEIVSAAGAGVFEHTIVAFWYFVCLSEMLLAIYKRLDSTSRFDGRVLGKMRDIEDVFSEYQILEPGDFTTRLTRLTNIIARELKESTNRGKSLSVNQVTNMVFRSGISKIRDLIVEHTSTKSPLFFLFDNIDKGWPANGVENDDITIVRLLIETLDKVRSDFATRDRNFESIVFVRHDVYDLVMNQTPDRGKSGQVSIDWTDRAKLAQVIYKRLQVTLSDKRSTLDELWAKLFPQTVNGFASFDYLVDHSVMRPRFLIDLIEGAIANAINRGHLTVGEQDCKDAVEQHSAALVDDFGFEMRDVSGLDSGLLYSLIGCDRVAERSYFQNKLARGGLAHTQTENAIELMLWYGLLGVVDYEKEDRYIYDYGYNVRRLNAEIARSDHPLLVVNPALFVGLSS